MGLVHRPAADLTAAELSDLLALRAAVFVVEQGCAYADADGRDVGPGTSHLWWADDEGEVLACARLLVEPSGWRLGRIATRADARGRGLAGQLITAALAATEGPVVMGAQAHLADWYAMFGFVVDGDVYDDDGIPHIDMRLER